MQGVQDSRGNKELIWLFLIAGDMRISTVIVDGFEILGADRKPGNIIIIFQR
jgi:hypothetical protein